MSFLSPKRVRHVLFLYTFFFALAFLAFNVIFTSFYPTDFCQDYVASQHILTRGRVYSPTNCWRRPFPGTHEYPAHPPFFELLFSPFAHLSMTYAALIWGGISLLCLLLSIWLLL